MCGTGMSRDRPAVNGGRNRGTVVSHTSMEMMKMFIQ